MNDNFLAIFIGMILAVMIIRSIVDPIKKTVDFTVELGKGYLCQRLNYQTNGELGEMTGAWAAMADKETASAEIGKISMVIDDITFQTNLLASLMGHFVFNKSVVLNWVA